MLTYENQKIKEGYNLIAGMDEAGRGPLAGAVFCAICIMPISPDKITKKSVRKKIFPIKNWKKLYTKC